ncbi:hypothetical protein CesoFtcFv8_021983 [Champsocephalus esox]|uniref:Uncharacterized protein n=1 Tax=Champsocephalus esox TaxID=159716 RepID=A0AAN8BAL3_9TELE|nr:hypothetical protein CesoFtcFv8_021983 [Champsocephalus esox]
MWKGAVAGLGEEERAEAGAAAWKGLRWSWMRGWNWKDEPQRWQKKRRRKRMKRKQRGVCGESLRRMLNWQKNNRCWSCFWYLSQRRKKTKRGRMKNRAAG